MKEFLKKLKLIDYLQIELEMPKDDFVNKLRLQVEKGSMNYLSDMFDIFSSSKKQLKGEVNPYGFRIKKKRTFFDLNLAMAEGTYKQKDNLLLINAEINGFSGIMIPFYVFCILIYSIFFITFLSLGKIGGNVSVIAIPFILLHATFMMGVPYIIMRKSTKKLKHELEREFFYLTKK